MNAGRGPALAGQEMANKIYHLSDMIRKARRHADYCRLTLSHYAVIDSSIINANLNPVARRADLCVSAELVENRSGLERTTPTARL